MDLLEDYKENYHTGWIRIFRSIRNHWIWNDPVKFQRWIDILLEVNHSTKTVNIGYKNFECKKGECLVSLESWGKRWNVSKSVVNNFFRLLENDGMITIKNETVTTRLTVCNYETYQQEQNANKTQQSSNDTATIPQQSTTNNDKNEKNKKNDILEREKEFKEKVFGFKEYSNYILNSFFMYWSEPNKSGTKMKFELQKTFEISRRLLTWKNNDKKYNHPATNYHQQGEHEDNRW